MSDKPTVYTDMNAAPDVTTRDPSLVPLRQEEPDIFDGVPQQLRIDSSGRLMWTPESRPMITQELADAFEAGIEFYIKFTGPSVIGGVVNEKPDGTLDWRPLAERWARERAELMTKTD